MTGSSDLPEELRRLSVKVKTLIQGNLSPEGAPVQLYEASRHLTSAGGKMLRPYLAVKTCEAVGGREEDVLPAAAALELLHTFTLIHDDIIDNDQTRRGVPTVHSRWGIPVAILAGDLLFANVYRTVLGGGLPPERTIRVLSLITEATVKLCEGQMLDITFPNLQEVEEEEYLKMIRWKTSYLFKTAAEVGGVAGGGTEEQIAALGSFADLSGVGFQIVDDVLGLTADERKLGKPVGSDIREGKKTLPVIHALNNASQGQKALIWRAIGGNATQEEILAARDLMVSLGSVEYTKRKARGYVEAAMKRLDVIPASPAKGSLIQLCNLLVSREF